MRQLIFEKTNSLRLEKGLSKLKQLDSLMDLAQLHSENMVKYNFYAHVDHLGDVTQSKIAYGPYYGRCNRVQDKL